MTATLNTFAGLPQFMWENIFSLLNFLVPGIILAIFTAYYQNWRKREIQLEGKLSVIRIETYEKVLALFYQAQDLKEPTLQEERDANSIIGYFKSPTFQFQYPAIFSDEATFDSFYSQFQELQRECQIYLDYSVSNQLNHSMSFFTMCKNYLDAYSDTERIVDFKFSKAQYRNHIDWVYRLFGMLMFSHSTMAFVELDNAVSSQLRHFRIDYRRHFLRETFSGLRDRVLFFFDIRRDCEGLVGKISRKVLHKSLPSDTNGLTNIMLEITEIMRYVHFSDKYSPADYFECRRTPSQKDLDLYNQGFMSQVHKS